MTKRDKNLIKDILLNVNYHSYKGKTDLRTLLNNITNTYYGNNIEWWKSEKCRMEIINKFFLVFNKIWKTEKEDIITYLNEYGRYSALNTDGNKIEKIMNKYHKTYDHNRKK